MITPIQQLRVSEMERQGYQVIRRYSDVVRMIRGSDYRLVKADGSIKRGAVKPRGRV